MQPQNSGGSWLVPIVAISAVLVFGLVYLNSGGNQPAEGVTHPAVGSKLSALEVVPLIEATEPVALADLQGEVTLVNFWGPWCYYCLLEMPHLVELNRKLSAEPDFRLLSISSPARPSPDLDRLRKDSLEEMTKVEASWPVYADPQQVTASALVQVPGMEQGFGFPTTFLLDREGTIAGMWIGYAPGMELEMEAAVRQVLAKK